RAWTETDPGVRAGEFAAEYATLRTDAPLKRSLELFRKVTADADRIRPYAMVFAREKKDVGSAKICFEGSLEGSKRAEHLAVVDAQDPDEAAQSIADGPALLRDHRIATWLSVKTVAEIPR